MDLIKVDIVSGRVLTNNLKKLWAAEALGPRADKTACGGGNLTPVVIDAELWQRIKKYNRRRRVNSWTNEELYTLAAITGGSAKKLPQAASRLKRSRNSCRLKFYELKRAGIIR